MSDQDIEQRIQTSGKSAPHVTPADIEAVIAHEYYCLGAGAFSNNMLDAFSAEQLMRLTLCVLVLKNGFVVVGTCACASLAQFDAEIGRKLARQNAINQLWPILGYQLKEGLYQAQRHEKATHPKEYNYPNQRGD